MITLLKNNIKVELVDVTSKKKYTQKQAEHIDRSVNYGV